MNKQDIIEKALKAQFGKMVSAYGRQLSIWENSSNKKTKIRVQSTGKSHRITFLGKTPEQVYHYELTQEEFDQIIKPTE